MPTLTLGISRCIPTLASLSLSHSFHVLPTFNESCGVTSGYLYLGFVALDLFQLHFTVYFGSLPCSAFSYFIFSSCGPYLIKVNLSRKSFFSLSLSLPRRTAIYSFRPSCLDRVRFVISCPPCRVDGGVFSASASLHSLPYWRRKRAKWTSLGPGN